MEEKYDLTEELLPPLPETQEQSEQDDAPSVPAETTQTPPAERVTVCDVQFRSGSKIYYFDPADLNLKAGDHVIIDTSRGAEYGTCVAGNHRVLPRELVQPLRRVLRIATEADEIVRAENLKREKEAFAFCLKKIEELGLDMQLVSTECAFDGSKLLFFFTADARVDFRELVRILAFNFHTRIELRQIGVRDKAKMLGGLGICGRPFCCAQFLDDFQPVSIKMAKTQNLSLNPAKISGTCGRLMCCLKYEQDAYEDLIKTSPKAESFVDTPDGRGTVTAVNLMRQSVNVRMEKDPEEIRCYRNCDICVLRSGKGKPGDPPIPEELAPISGRREERFGDPLSQLDHRLTVDPGEDTQTEEPLQPERRQNRRPRRERTEEPETEWTADPAEHRDRRRDKKQDKAPNKQEQRSEPPQEAPQPAPAKQPQSQTKPAQAADKSGETAKPAREQDRKYHRRGKKPAGKNPEGQKPPVIQQPKKPVPEQNRKPVQQPAQAASEQAKSESAKKNNRRRYYHNRRPKSGGQG